MCAVLHIDQGELPRRDPAIAGHHLADNGVSTTLDQSMIQVAAGSRSINESLF